MRFAVGIFGGLPASFYVGEIKFSFVWFGACV
jgi:hypothetical protein